MIDQLATQAASLVGWGMVVIGIHIVLLTRLSWRPSYPDAVTFVVIGSTMLLALRSVT
jgi:hypothetical protein